MELREDESRPLETIGGPNFDARTAMGIIDAVIVRAYMPFRGAEGYQTERAILVAPPHLHHRENDAEHSWHVGITAEVIHDNRQELGLEGVDDIDVGLMRAFSTIHDLIEIESGDVNALTHDLNEIELKSKREAAAYERIVRDQPHLRGVMEIWREYDRKDTPEAQFVSDIDKIIACRMIYLDGGAKWHDWEGEQTSRDEMLSRIRAKLLTDMGQKLFDIIEEDILARPEVFPFIESSEHPLQLVIPEVGIGF